jgi:hypothetical protein
MSQATAEQATTTVEELLAELRAELVAKREAGTTLAELKKAFPQVAPDVIRAVLPPLPKGTEPKPAPRKPQAAQTAATGQGKGRASATKGGKAQPKPTTNGGTTDKERLKLAAQIVKLRDTDRLSWLKIGAALKLAEDAATPKAAASRARTLYGSSRARMPTPGRLPTREPQPLRPGACMRAPLAQGRR